MSGTGGPGTGDEKGTGGPEKGEKDGSGGPEKWDDDATGLMLHDDRRKDDEGGARKQNAPAGCKVKIVEVRCRTALSRSGLSGLEYSLNPYKGCEHGCLYCYAPAVLHYEGKTPWGCFVEARTNIPVALAHELRRLPKGTVGVGTVTDPYQPAELKYRLTRHCLEQLLHRQWPVCVQTKSNNVVEDIDILRRFGNVEVGMTVTAPDDGERKCFEPGASSVDERIEALGKLGTAGVPTFVFFGPVLPGTTGDETALGNLFGRMAAAKVGRVMVDRLRVHPGVWDRLRPGVLARHKELAGAYEEVLFGSSDDYERRLMDIVELARGKGLSARLVDRP
jgi:DNA repair photolyase